MLKMEELLSSEGLFGGVRGVGGGEVSSVRVVCFECCVVLRCVALCCVVSVVAWCGVDCVVR